MHRALFALAPFVCLACSGSDFGVADSDGGTDGTTQDSIVDDSTGTDTHGDTIVDTRDAVDTAPKCPTGTLYRTMGPFSVGDKPGAVAAGDLNKDGHLDLVVADDSSQVTVLVGAGDGTFPTRHDFPVGDHPLDVDLGDVNGDGALDVVVTSVGAKDVELLTGSGDGYLHAMKTIASFSSPTASTLAKLDGDDLLDLAVVDAGTNTLVVRKGNGDGTFTASGAPLSVGLAPLAVSAVKLGSSSTAAIDLVVAATEADEIDVVHGPSLSSVAPTISGVTAPYAIAFGDFDVDGHTDIAAADHTDGTALVLIADGTGAFAAPKSWPAVASATSIVSADLDGDGHVDLFVGSNAEVDFLKGHASGSFAAPMSLSAPGAGLAAGDFDGDSHADVAATDPSGSVRVFLSCAH